jgi:NAD(P)-dependent dehydrogenase (short-subunit alcohol dehydrogenase family)
VPFLCAAAEWFPKKEVLAYMEKLEGKVALITGASRGIGEGIAKVYAKYGAKLVLAARSKATETLAEQLRALGAEAMAVAVDVTDAASVRAGVEKAVKAFGTIDVLVNNAGVSRLNNFLNLSDADLDFHIDVNLKGVWNATRAVLPYMIQQKSGRIVVMSSVTGAMVADPGEVAYATTKAALIGFTKSLAREVAPYRIAVNAVCPGYVLTPMARDMAQKTNPEDPQSVLDGIAGTVPLGRLAEPEEIGELAAFLRSGESSYLTGAQIVIDGGSTLPETSVVGAG